MVTMPNFRQQKRTEILDRTAYLEKVNLRQNNPDYLILHSTHSYPTFDDLLRFHKGTRGWAGIGYHVFVSGDSTAYQNRPYTLEGAHAFGFNTRSIGLCVFTDKTKKDDLRVKKTRDVIAFLTELYPNMQVISHTQSQIKYNNDLLRKAGIAYSFPDDPEVVDEKIFAQIKQQMDDLSGKLATEKYEALKKSLKSFKNCPGRVFWRLVR